MRTDRGVRIGFHRGINMTRVAGEGLEGLPGVLIMIAFVFIFAGMFVPRDSGGLFLAIFLAVEAVAGILQVMTDRLNRKESERLRKVLHRINEKGHAA